MSFEVEGKLYKKFDTEKKTDTFSAREFVLEVADGNYPQLIKFQLVQDKCALMDNYQEGEILKVHFDLRGREWNDKYFTNLNAWRIRDVGPQADLGDGPAASGRVTRDVPVRHRRTESFCAPKANRYVTRHRLPKAIDVIPRPRERACAPASR
jgi:single-strand DNA-binding protein